MSDARGPWGLNPGQQQPEPSRGAVAGNTSSLPTLPGYIFALSEILDTSSADVGKIEAILRTEPCLTAEVIRRTNLHLPHGSVPVSGLSEALRRLSRERLRMIVLTSPMLDLSADPVRWMTVQSFWQYSYMSACAAEVIAGISGVVAPEKAYVAGLLHDIGELSLMLTPERREGPGHGGKDVSAHENAGRNLAALWRLPLELVEVCGSHHSVHSARQNPALVQIIRAADIFCALCGLGIGVRVRRLVPESDEFLASTMMSALPSLGKSACRELLERLKEMFFARLGQLEFAANGMLKAAVEREAGAAQRFFVA